jgi:carbonic anhydrase/acetyltransferase-like protein (isoleucine patch superfamily)
VLGGVRIGKGCVIGANSLVTRVSQKIFVGGNRKSIFLTGLLRLAANQRYQDIPDYHLAYGSPARPIRKISGPPAGEEWTLSTVTESVTTLANRPLRVKDGVYIASVVVILWSCLVWVILSQAATS